MDYEKSYNKLLNTIMNEAENIHVETLQKVQAIHEETNKGNPHDQTQKDRQLKNEIMNIKDNTERQQTIKQNMELFQ